jgi:hypothetical protein
MFECRNSKAAKPMTRQGPSAGLFWAFVGHVLLLVTCLSLMNHVTFVPPPALSLSPTADIDDQPVLMELPDGDDSGADDQSFTDIASKHHNSLIDVGHSALGRLWRGQRRFLPVPVGLVDTRLELTGLAATPIVIVAGPAVERTRQWLPKRARGP